MGQAHCQQLRRCCDGSDLNGFLTNTAVEIICHELIPERLIGFGGSYMA